MTVVCDVVNCKYNGGKFCNKPILIIKNAVCNEIFYKDGRQKPPNLWAKTSEQYQQDIERNQKDDNVR